MCSMISGTHINAVSENTTVKTESIEKTYDFWDETKRLFGTSSINNHINYNLEKRISLGYNPKNIQRDHLEKTTGDFSVKISLKHSEKFGFVLDLWNKGITLNKNYKISFDLKTPEVNCPDEWTIKLVDSNNRVVSAQINGFNTHNKWKNIETELSILKAEKKFNWKEVALCEFEAGFIGNESINIDNIQFISSDNIIRITDKTLLQRKEEANASKKIRTEHALTEITNDKKATLFTKAFAMLYLKKDIKQANDILMQALEESEKTHDGWSLEVTPALCRIYYWFSSNCGKLRGRLNKETEKRLLEVLWNRTYIKNDIHLAFQGNTWWMDGSENHDLNAKMCNLVTSRIFMNEPLYKDRIYPDYGFGGGYKYGHAGYHGMVNVSPERYIGGRANLSDGKQYKATDHYEAWLKFMTQYIKERAERGIMLEYGSSTYSKHSYNFFELGYSYSGNEEFKSLMGKFLTLYWADWAQVSIDGVRGGAKTRHHKTVGGNGNGAELVNFYMGSAGNPGVYGFWNMFCDYELPDILWKMSLDREGLGKFEYISKGIGEEENIYPRPLGTERGMLCNTDSRLLRYAYITPYYVLGTQMDHPAAVHSHLSAVGRWHGMTFAQSENSRIVPYGYHKDANNIDMEIMFQTVQHKNTLILQQFRQYSAAHPDWYPTKYEGPQDIAIWLGNNWDKLIEKNGWIFVQKGGAYAAVRTVLWDETYEKENAIRNNGTQILFNGPHDVPTVKIKNKSYKWDNNHTSIISEDKFAAIIIESADIKDYDNIKKFMGDILDNPLKLYKTVVPGYHILTYTGCGKDNKEIVLNLASPQIPTVGGEYVNYLPDYTFNSPYINSEYRSGKVVLTYENDNLILDFNTK